MKTLDIQIFENLDSDEMKYLIRKLTKIQGFQCNLKLHYKVICQYHQPIRREILK